MKQQTSTTSLMGGMNLSDVYYVIFRQKWKIIVMTLAGLIGAVMVYYTMPPTYLSVSNLLVKYINGGNAGNTAISQDQHQLDPGVVGILKNEATIIKSFDLAIRVATNLGPEKILAHYGGGNDANAAAAILRESLVVDRASEQGSVLAIMLSLTDRDLVQSALREYVEEYKQWHIQIHEVVPQEHDVLSRKGSLIAEEIKEDQTELRLLKTAAGVNNLEVSKNTFEAQIQQYQQSIRLAQIELDEHQALLESMLPATNSAAVTNSSDSKTNLYTEHEVAKDKIDDYSRACKLYDNLWANYMKDQEIYKSDSPHQVERMKKIKEAEATKRKMEADEPLLTSVKYKKADNSSEASFLTQEHIAEEESQVNMVKVKLNGLIRNLNEIKASVTNLAQYEGKITDAEHKLNQAQRNYDNVQTALNTIQMEADLSQIRNANIFVIQNATPPVKEQSKTPRMMAFTAVGGLVAGLAWAFAIELLLDRSVKRSKDIETDLGMRLFLTIPKFGRNGRRRARRAPKKSVREGKPGGLLPAIKEESQNGELVGHAEIAPWDENHPLHEYYDALRDRLMTYFEIHNLTHKPKLVAVTGSSKGSGATTIAAGLAASLSEGGVGANVLLIDMNQEQGAAHHFYNGEPSIGLDDALALETKSSAKFQDHLYVVGGGNRGDKLSSMLPKKFQNLLPKLRASDYDYIIFDMPTISRTGVTQRLAGFMDMMLLVVEAEKTQKEVLRQANALLMESKAKVSVVLNKTQTYVPEAIQQEF